MPDTISLSTPMLGPVDSDAARIAAPFKGHAYDDATVAAFAAALIKWTGVFGLRTSIIAAQIAKETGYFKYGGDVPASAFNLAGLGATGGGVAGLRYPDIGTGVCAVCAHHMTYIHGDVQNWPPGVQQYVSLDKRYAAVLSTGRAGTVKTIGNYTNGNWAYTASIPVGSLANGYATGIASLANQFVGASPVPTPGDLKLIDIRDQLQTNADGGPNTAGTTPRLGVVIHYSAVNYPADRPILDILKSEAAYHCAEDWGGGARGDGLMYHISVDPVTGERYQCRDLDATLWHCASWAAGGNGSGYAVHVPGGSSLVMSDAALASLAGLCDALGARDGFDRSMVKGHQEMSSTACPGPLMQQFVLPYRAGKITPPAPPPPPDNRVNGHVLAGGFRALWDGTPDRLRVFGLPLSEEYDGTLTTADKQVLPVTVIDFERNQLIYDVSTPDPFRVRVPLRSERVKKK